MAELVIKLVNGELAGKTAQSIAKEIREAGKAASKAEAGTKAWVDAHARLDKAKSLQEDLRKQVEATTGASNMLKNAWNALPGAEYFNQIGDSFSMLKSGVGGLTTGFKVLKFAIAATGLGLLVILLGSLVGWFTKTERGGDLLAKVMAALGAAVSVVIDRASKLIDALIAFVNGNWTEAAKKFGEATSNVTKEIVEETKAAWALADALDKLEELEGQLILIRSRTKQQVSELRLLAKDETKTIGERSAALQKAIELTRALNQQELEAKKGRVLQALQVKDLNELQQKYGVTLDQLLAKGEDILTVDNLGLGESTQEDLNKAFEALASYNEAIASSADAERTIITELNTLKKKARSEDAKDQAAANKAKEEALKAEREAQEEEYRAMENIRKLEAEKRLAEIEDEKARELEALNMATEEKITQLEGSEAQILEQIKLLRDIQGEEIAAIEQKWADKKAEDEKKRREEEHAALMEEYDRRIEEAQRYEDAKSQIEREGFDAAQDISGSFIDLLSTDEKARKKHAQVIKAIQVGSVTASLASEIQAIWEHANKNPANALFPGAATVIAVVKTVAAAARAGAALGRINSAKFAMGGLLKGPKHSQGGIPGVITTTGEPIEMEGDEFILSGKATRALGAGNLIRLNNYLTRKLATGGPSNPFADRAPVASGAASSAAPIMPESAQLIAEVRALRAEVSAWPTRLRVVNVVTDTEEGIRTINSIKAEADV